MARQKLGALQLFLLGILSAFGPLSLDLYLPGLPEMQQNLNTTPTMIQLTITASLIGLAIGQIIIGPWSDRVGRRRALLVGVGIFTLATVGIILTPNIYGVILFRFIQGLGGSAGIVLSLAVIADSFEGLQLTRNVALNQMINGVFPIVAPVIGGVIIALSHWQMTFIVLAVLGAVLWVAIYTSLPETAPEFDNSHAQMTPKQTFKTLWSNKGFMFMAWTQAFMMAGLFAYIAGSTFVLETIYDLSILQFSIVYAINGLGILIAAHISAKLAAKMGEYHALGVFVIISLMGGSLVWLNVVLSNHVLLMCLAFFLIVAPVGGVSSLTTSIAMQHVQTGTGAASGILGLMRYAMGGLVSPLVGLMGADSLIPLAIVIAVVQVLGTMMYLKSRP
ncbi:multidrug effflux MFS transporter [Weissella tructae]|uniref:Bcr/CflA family efflux transporter n=2 Tax=Weissella TaxID=46255 RepID=A0A075U049_9LACO|nr:MULTISPECIES: multidrug effflux MFS transporter [Weissella]AIG65905.1 Permease of the major facilitator superfamily protein [Weissella tructae]AIM63284.1 Permease of the major facilitator superfamily protein [Weissella ceti]AIM64618.1 Permease of the major facilitator superfamily protein [Weissella ceti]ELA07276.1 major facilitator superfamily permease [Weissella ceti NC36]QVV91065.1 multidrug effflux MFS transporter [Weissella tructae]